MKVLLLMPLLWASVTFAQEVTIALPDMFCQVEQFSPGMNIPPTAAHKKCDNLKDGKEVKVESSGGCKEHALAKMGECLQRLKAEKVAVRWRFTEKFKNTSNTTKFTCELDNKGDNSCP
ncbi:MAG: hypothetical protein KF799_10940 [Bdellovibrionales bacterium]|nr:hypothetical protein [Bdellovibrionales bacterium]